MLASHAVIGSTGFVAVLGGMTIEMVRNPDTTLPFVSDNYLYDNGRLFGEGLAYYVQLYVIQSEHVL